MDHRNVYKGNNALGCCGLMGKGRQSSGINYGHPAIINVCLSLCPPPTAGTWIPSQLLPVLSLGSLLCVHGHRLLGNLQLGLILPLQVLQVNAQTIRIQPGVSGSLQEAGGQAVDCPLAQNLGVTVLFSLEVADGNHRTELYMIAVNIP